MTGLNNRKVTKERRGFKRKREVEIFLSKIKIILSCVIDYQEGRISDADPIILAINKTQNFLGRRQEDLTLGSEILFQIERIVSNLKKD